MEDEASLAHRHATLEKAELAFSERFQKAIKAGWLARDGSIVSPPCREVFIIELSGCEWGGAADVAFSTHDKAKQWVVEQESKQSYPRVVNGYEIKKVAIQ